VARDRKRAKQRRRRAGAPERSTTTAPDRASAPPSTQPTRADTPGALDHASGDADEFDAALVRGAGGVTATPETGPEAELTDEASEQLEVPEALPGRGDGGEGGRDGGDGGRGGGDGGTGGPARGRAPGAPLRGGSRALAFLEASWAELQRVQWPDRRQVTQATAVVLGFVVVAGAYLGAADFVASEIVEFVLA
jgi:preprotein translocase SecE subunit